jgi:hypothetical protein
MIAVLALVRKQAGKLTGKLAEHAQLINIKFQV